MSEGNNADVAQVMQAVDKVLDILLPLEPSVRERAAQVVATYFAPTPKAAKRAVAGSPTPREFMHGFDINLDSPGGLMHRLGSYLTLYCGMKEFRGVDLSILNMEAGLPKVQSPDKALRSAERMGLLRRDHESGLWQLAAAPSKHIDAAAA